MSHSLRLRLSRARRIVVKVGTRVVSREDGGVALGRLGRLVEQIHELRGEGREVLLVSSGAVGIGARRLGFPRRPTALIDRQACAAAGQGALMGLYDSMFSRLGERCAQVLLTEDDLGSRRRHVNLASTLQRLLALQAVPIINENDSVSANELALRKGEIFGDNDRLAALVASALGCDALVLLTDVDGVYTAPPHQPGAERISVWNGDEVHIGATSEGGRGGMESKIAAAEVAARAGVAAVVGSGFAENALWQILAGDDVGTFFRPASGMNRRRQWLAFATAPEGTFEVNAGARAAMVDRQASLLPPGLVGIEGEFAAGAVVSVSCDGEEFARGISALSSAEARAADWTGGRNKALVHRDKVVILIGDS